ncbi:MAG: CCA tRNA nucleotidyltransferase [Planctomycetaceae bacterium]|nr:CCA tRNA nucleotidyltransferase [Planctomycetaceae bacterium]
MTHPAREFATEVVERLRREGFQSLFAGGCVRDLLLGREPQDFDVATNATPEQVRDLFGRRRTLAVGASFGVMIVLGPDHVQVEVATFRKEGPYHDGRRPASVAFCEPEQDALRRDFTINGMFYDPLESRVLDYVHGETDLAAGVIRAIGEPRERFREDKLRLLRAVRFAATLEFELEPRTAEAVREMAGELLVVSAERIAQELRKMLSHPHRRRAMRMLDECGLLAVVFPELPDDPASRERAGERLHLLPPKSGFELGLAALLSELPVTAIVRPICRRLKLSNHETNRIVWLVEESSTLDEAATWSMARLKRLFAHPDSRQLLQLARAQRLAQGRDLHAILHCEEFLARTPPEELDPPPLLTGNDLIGLGLSPGPAFKDVLEQVRDAQLNGEIDSADAAILLARQLGGGESG